MLLPRQTETRGDLHPQSHSRGRVTAGRPRERRPSEAVSGARGVARAGGAPRRVDGVTGNILGGACEDLPTPSPTPAARLPGPASCQVSESVCCPQEPSSAPACRPGVGLAAVLLTDKQCLAQLTVNSQKGRCPSSAPIPTLLVIALFLFLFFL